MLGRRRPLARAAMVGGAAYYAGKRVEQGRQAEYEQDERLAALEAQQAQQQYAPPPPQYAPPPPPPAPAPAAAAPQVDIVAELEKLAALKEKGILTDAEFDAQKQRLLQSQ
jgi:hypothetical protein